MEVTVVIPTLNEEKHIRECLESVWSNTVKPIEILVCDGGSADETVRIAESLGAKVLINKDRTAATGRNLGIASATGDIIAFTDGDCKVDVHWIESFLKEFEDCNVDGVGGKTIPADTDNEIERFWGHISLEVIMSFPDHDYTVTNRTLNDAFITANCSYRTDFLREIGGFDPWFGNNAEDVDLSWRALSHGAKLRYCPHAVVIAHSPQTIRGMCQKSFRNGVSSTKLQKVHSGEESSLDIELYRTLIRSIIGTFKMNKQDLLLSIELTCHIWGKISSSRKLHYRNW